MCRNPPNAGPPACTLVVGGARRLALAWTVLWALVSALGAQGGTSVTKNGFVVSVNLLESGSPYDLCYVGEACTAYIRVAITDSQAAAVGARGLLVVRLRPSSYTGSEPQTLAATDLAARNDSEVVVSSGAPMNPQLAVQERRNLVVPWADARKYCGTCATWGGAGCPLRWRFKWWVRTPLGDTFETDVGSIDILIKFPPAIAAIAPPALDAAASESLTMYGPRTLGWSPAYAASVPFADAWLCSSGCPKLLEMVDTPQQYTLTRAALQSVCGANGATTGCVANVRIAPPCAATPPAATGTVRLLPDPSTGNPALAVFPSLCLLERLTPAWCSFSWSGLYFADFFLCRAGPLAASGLPAPASCRLVQATAASSDPSAAQAQPLASLVTADVARLLCEAPLATAPAACEATLLMVPSGVDQDRWADVASAIRARNMTVSWPLALSDASVVIRPPDAEGPRTELFAGWNFASPVDVRVCSPAACATAAGCDPRHPACVVVARARTAANLTLSLAELPARIGWGSWSTVAAHCGSVAAAWCTVNVSVMPTAVAGAWDRVAGLDAPSLVPLLAYAARAAVWAPMTLRFPANQLLSTNYGPNADCYFEARGCLVYWDGPAPVSLLLCRTPSDCERAGPFSTSPTQLGPFLVGQVQSCVAAADRPAFLQANPFWRQYLCARTLILQPAAGLPLLPNGTATLQLRPPRSTPILAAFPAACATDSASGCFLSFSGAYFSDLYLCRAPANASDARAESFVRSSCALVAGSLEERAPPAALRANVTLAHFAAACGTANATESCAALWLVTAADTDTEFRSESGPLTLHRSRRVLQAAAADGEAAACTAAAGWPACAASWTGRGEAELFLCRRTACAALACARDLNGTCVATAPAACAYDNATCAPVSPLQSVRVQRSPAAFDVPAAAFRTACPAADLVGSGEPCEALLLASTPSDPASPLASFRPVRLRPHPAVARLAAPRNCSLRAPCPLQWTHPHPVDLLLCPRAAAPLSPALAASCAVLYRAAGPPSDPAGSFSYTPAAADLRAACGTEFTRSCEALLYACPQSSATYPGGCLSAPLAVAGVYVALARASTAATCTEGLRCSLAWSTFVGGAAAAASANGSVLSDAFFCRAPAPAAGACSYLGAGASAVDFAVSAKLFEGPCPAAAAPAADRPNAVCGGHFVVRPSPAAAADAGDAAPVAFEPAFRAAAARITFAIGRACRLALLPSPFPLRLSLCRNASAAAANASSAGPVCTLFRSVAAGGGRRRLLAPTELEIVPSVADYRFLCPAGAGWCGGYLAAEAVLPSGAREASHGTLPVRLLGPAASAALFLAGDADPEGVDPEALAAGPLAAAGLGEVARLGAGRADPAAVVGEKVVVPLLLPLAAALACTLQLRWLAARALDPHPGYLPALARMHAALRLALAALALLLSALALGLPAWMDPAFGLLAFAPAPGRPLASWRALCALVAGPEWGGDALGFCALRDGFAAAFAFGVLACVLALPQLAAGLRALRAGAPEGALVWALAAARLACEWIAVAAFLGVAGTHLARPSTRALFAPGAPDGTAYGPSLALSFAALSCQLAALADLALARPSRRVVPLDESPSPGPLKPGPWPAPAEHGWPTPGGPAPPLPSARGGGLPTLKEEAALEAEAAH